MPLHVQANFNIHKLRWYINPSDALTFTMLRQYIHALDTLFMYAKVGSCISLKNKFAFKDSPHRENSNHFVTFFSSSDMEYAILCDNKSILIISDPGSIDNFTHLIEI